MQDPGRRVYLTCHLLDQDPQETLDAVDELPDSRASFDTLPEPDSTSSPHFDNLLSLNRTSRQCPDTSSMDMSSSYSGSTVFDTSIFEDASISSALSSCDVQGTKTLELLFDQPADFRGVGKWIDDSLFKNLSSMEIFLGSNAWSECIIDLDETNLSALE